MYHPQEIELRHLPLEKDLATGFLGLGPFGVSMGFLGFLWGLGQDLVLNQLSSRLHWV